MRAAVVDPPFDPFCAIPWEIIFDKAGRVIGEVYLLEIPPPPKRRKKAWKKKKSNR
jgi:hypothetical protein